MPDADWTIVGDTIYHLNGNVGIGTTTPNEQLKIAGNLRLPSTAIIKVGADRFIHNYGHYNTFVGRNAGNLTMTGSYNAVIGYQALYSNTTGSSNAVSGRQALYSNTSGSLNTANGDEALVSNTTGTGNTANGFNALYYNTTGSDNTALGDGAYVSSGNLTNATAIGAEAVVDASNKVRIGNTSVTSIGGQVGWTTFSDGRYKKSTSQNVPGLAFISKLKPVTYTMDVDAIDAALRPPHQSLEERNPENLNPSAEEIASKQAQSQIVYTGFIAQEVEQAAKEIGYDFSGVDVPKNDKGMYGLRYAEFVVPLVKAVQEQQQMIQEQQQIIQELQKRIEELEKR
jgi:hypothetical protein